MPLWVQLAFIFSWLGLIAFLSTLGGGSDQLQQIKESITPELVRFDMLFQALLVFILPVIFDVFLLRRERLSFLTLGKRVHPLWLLGAIFAIFFAMPAASWLGELNSQVHFPSSLAGVEGWMREKEQENSFIPQLLLEDKSVQGLFLNLLTMALLPALSEELFFRGMLQRTLMDTRMNAHMAIWITAILFSGFHLQFFGFFPRLFLGAVLGYLFYFTGSLWISIIAHFLNNAFIVAMNFATSKVVLNPLEKNAEEFDMQISPALVALSLLLVVGVFVLLHRMQKNIAEEG